MSTDPIVEAVHADPVVKAVLAGDSASKGTVTTQAGNVVASPTSTEEEDRSTAGQRSVNMMWEGTQRNIAMGFAYGSILMCFYIIVMGPKELQLAALTYILTMGATINQNYFTRTNHTKQGARYEGR